MPTRSELITQARTWLGVSAIASGAQRSGVSCLGLPIGILRELGGFGEMVIEAERYIGFKRPMSPGDLLRKLSTTKHLRVVRPSTLTPGNLVLFFTMEGPQHIGLITEPGIVLHAAQAKKKVVEHLIPSNWRVASEFELVGLEDG